VGPTLEEFAETLDGGRVVLGLPDEDERDGLFGREGNEFEKRVGGENELGDDADAGAGFDVGHNRADEARGVGEARDDAGAAASRNDGVVKAHAFAAGEDNEGFARERFPRNRGAAGEWMFFGNDDAEGFFAEQISLQAAGFVTDDGTGDGGGEAIFGDHFPDAFGRAFFEVNRDAREPALIFGEKTAQKGFGGRADVAEAKFAFFAGGGPADATKGFFELLEKLGGFAQENGAGGREAHVMTAAFEDGGAEFGFELLDGAAEGGLGDVQTFGGAGKAEFFGHGAEVLQETEFHSVIAARHHADSEDIFPLQGTPAYYLPWGPQEMNKLLMGLALAVGLAGCGRRTDMPRGDTGKVRVGYIGLSCEAPIYTAVEKGFFKEEGLDVTLVKCEWSNYKDVLALGGYDVTHHLVMYFLKPIEQGLDVKFTGGIHRGCLRVQASTKGDIKTVKDLKGKRIGVPGMGTPPFIFANRVLGANGIDPAREVTWLVFPAGELGLALDKGEVDAVADSEPIGSMLVAQGKVRNVADQAVDAPYNQEYCCAVLANGKFLKENPKTTAGATRALLRAAKWVEANPAAAARLSVEKKYLASTVEQNAVAISHLRYVPSVLGAETAVKLASGEMKLAGMLAPSTDVEALAKKAFVHLDGVTDEWLNSVKTETVADAKVPESWRKKQYAKASWDPFCALCINPPPQ
jgi:NitT/TauT family transport system substrate-binding protein